MNAPGAVRHLAVPLIAGLLLPDAGSVEALGVEREVVLVEIIRISDLDAIEIVPGQVPDKVSKTFEKVPGLRYLLPVQILELEDEMPELGIRDYLATIEEQFTETPFVLLDDVWEDEFRNLFGDENEGDEQS